MEVEAKHVVALSGGGDSTAMSLLLAETEPRDYEYIFNGTGNELPELYAHLQRLEGILGKPIKHVRYSTGLLGVIDEVAMLPNFRARFCTRMLKIEPTIEYFHSLPKGSVLYVGLLADEENRPGLYGEDIALRFPLREHGWNKAAVRNYLQARSIQIPKRTDCALCPYQRLEEWHALWKDHPGEYAIGATYEIMYGHTFRSPGRDTWPASLAELAKEFERGRPIRAYGKTKEAESCRVCRL